MAKKKMIVGYAYVCADILHTGHLLHLKNARNLCDKLVVGVLTEKAVMEKKKKPIMILRERMDLVGSLEFVDAVVAQEEYSPLSTIKQIKPDILFESLSHKKQPANDYVLKNGGRVISLPYYPDQSSSGIKSKIREKI